MRSIPIDCDFRGCARLVVCTLSDCAAVVTSPHYISKMNSIIAPNGRRVSFLISI